MAKSKKTTRTEIKDLPVSEKELTAAEAGRVKGGMKAAPIKKEDKEARAIPRTEVA